MLSIEYSVLLIISLFSACALANYGYLYIRNNGTVDRTELMNNGMGTIFMLFGVLKLANIEQFAMIFSKYDPLSQRVPIYAYLYPFIELILGASFFYPRALTVSYGITILLMSISFIGVSMSIGKGVSLRCGCLGSFFHIPLSYVTISENIAMLVMASYGLLK